MNMHKYSYLLALFFPAFVASAAEEIARKIVNREPIEKTLVEKHFDEKTNENSNPFKVLKLIKATSHDHSKFEVFGKEICKSINTLNSAPNLTNLNAPARANHINGSLNKFKYEYISLLDEVMINKKEQAEKRIDQLQEYIKLALIGEGLNLRRDIITSNLPQFFGGNTEDFKDSLYKASPHHKLLEVKNANRTNERDKRRRLN